MYHATKHVTDTLGLPEGTTIEFLRKGTALTPDKFVAVRANEMYEDIGAMWAGERTHVRPAWMMAGHVHVFPVHGKNPVMVLTKFESEAIREGEAPPSECAKNRATFHDKLISNKVKKFRGETAISALTKYRITAPTKTIEDLAAAAHQNIFLSTNGHHVEGMAVAHAHLDDGAVQQARDAGALVMPLDDIRTSRNAARQLTIRAQGPVNPDLFYNFITQLQAGGKTLDIPDLEPCFATYRTHNCVRMTLNKPVDGNMLRIIRVKLPANCIALTDVPLDVWAPSAGGDAERKTSKAPRPPTSKPKAQPAKPRVETPPGKKLVRLAANFEPHPMEFAIVAKAIGAELVRIEHTRYTAFPLACMVTFPEKEDITELLKEEFVVEVEGAPETGSWRCWLQGQAWV